MTTSTPSRLSRLVAAVPRRRAPVSLGLLALAAATTTAHAGQFIVKTAAEIEALPAETRSIIIVRSHSDEVIAALTRLKELRSVYFKGIVNRRVATSFVHLKELPHLETLTLEGDLRLTKPMVDHIKAVTTLNTLNLDLP